MPDQYTISSLTPISVSEPLGMNDLVEVSRVDEQGETGYSSRKATIGQLGDELLNDIQYTSALDTTSKKIIGAINEVNTKASQFDNMTATASGSIATFDNGGDDIPVSEFECEIVAQQASGTPTPSSPLPITGFSQADIVVCGKNLFNKNSPNIVSDKYLSADGNENYSASYSISDYIRVKDNVTISGSSTSGNSISVCWYDENKTFLSGEAHANHTFPHTYTVPTGAVYMRESIFNGDINTIQIELGAFASAYTPFVEGNLYTVAFGQTIYGGRLIYENGQWSIEATHLILSTSSANYYSSSTNKFVVNIVDNAIGYDGDNKCSVYSKSNVNNLTNIPNLTYICRQNFVVFRDDTYDNDLSGFISFMADKQFIYELETPVIIPLTSSTRVKTISGDNNIYSNTGDCEVKYFTNKADSLAELIKAFVL